MGGVAAGIGLMTEDTVCGGAATPEANMLTVEVGGGGTELGVEAVVIVAEADEFVDLFVGRGEDLVVDDRPARVGGFPAVLAGAAAALLEEPEAEGETEFRVSD